MTWLYNIFGSLLNFIYNFVNNYGVALILFSIITKIIMLPISIKQQKTLRASGKIQAELKEIQDKYSNDQERLSRETMDLYKRENMSPFSGCLSSILQIVLLLAMFVIVRQPLTYMLKMDTDTINHYEEIVDTSSAYKEIEVIKASKTNDEIDININMDFLGIDLSNVLMENWNDWTIYIIPVLYVLTSILSLKMNNASNNTNANKSNKDKSIVEDNKNKKVEKNDKEKALVKTKNDDDEQVDTMAEMNKSMQLMMPIMSIVIAIVVPLGLALYWLMNNILMIAERIILNKVLDKKEEA